MPGENAAKARQLRPPGAKFATKDRSVAELVAWDLYKNAMLDASGQIDGGDGTVGGGW